MNALPNPKTFTGRKLIVPVAVERDLEDWVNLGGGVIEDDSDPFDSYIEVTFEVCWLSGKPHWIVASSHPTCPMRDEKGWCGGDGKCETRCAGCARL